MSDYGEKVFLLGHKEKRPNEISGGGCGPNGCTGGVATPGSGTNSSGKLRCPAPISRLRVEKIEGGLMVAGVVVAANCQIILPIFGFLFTLVGCVLTAASYRGPGADEEPERYEARVAFTGNSRILGPGCIVVGVVMLAAGCALCVLTRRAGRRQRRDVERQPVGFHCPLHGDFYPLATGGGGGNAGSGGMVSVESTEDSAGSGDQIGIIEKNTTCGLCWPRKRGPGAIAVGPPQCPHSQVSSTRSSIASSPHSQCPTPLPFLVNSGSAGGIVSQSVQLSPEQQFGSIRSLTVGGGGREVASFPLSRTPTPPPGDRSHNLVHIPDEERLVNSHFEKIPVQREGPRKSVSIVLPTEEKG
ncbi:unnamed protein product [Acanthoscelides obtectus]|uniref:Uncharacterized protein n=1 Tax=Acanthoscelides obtectus TaxID=200917 RepID=A0A9P0PRJ5_ACAOB|nr:unnamed protein product [Acanthoscelides obtectus]CAK1684023.1 hypothetical protein AOBTE_LOCUS34585 [Acanthoscelides obtectus]